ncbi:MAG: hypothetical protein J6X18_10840 [Bacteroidales bacterium]|nr:hypothetical protein [Bacteroidales bacterium]
MNWINNISQSIDNVLSKARIPAQTLPAIPLFCETLQRPGLSATVLASRIISRLPDIGIPTGVNPDGSDNIVVKFVMVMCEEFVNTLKNEAVVSTSVPTGKIMVTGMGANAGGPVQVTGYNSMSTVIKGVMQ